jgi:hypothetical protein
MPIKDANFTTMLRGVKSILDLDHPTISRALYLLALPNTATQHVRK